MNPCKGPAAIEKASLERIDPAAVRAYLERRQAMFRGNFFSEALCYELQGQQLIVPNSSSLIDYATALAKLIRQLAAIEHRSLFAIFRELEQADADILQAGWSDETLPSLCVHTTFLTQLQKFLFTAASLSAGTAAAQSFLHTLRCDTRCTKDFPVTLLSPVPKKATDKDAEECTAAIIPHVQVLLTIVEQAVLTLGQEDRAASLLQGLAEAGAGHGDTEPAQASTFCLALTDLLDVIPESSLSIRIVPALTRDEETHESLVILGADHKALLKKACDLLQDNA